MPFPLRFRDWTIPSEDAVRARFWDDLRAGRGWYPPDFSPVPWLADLAHEHPEAVPVAENIAEELLDAADPDWNAEGIVLVEGLPGAGAQGRLARRVAAGWQPDPDILRAAVSKLLLLKAWMAADPTLADRVAVVAERAGLGDLAARLRYVAHPRDPAVWADYAQLAQGGVIRAPGLGADAAWTLATNPDLTERHCRLARGLSEADRRLILGSVAVVAASRGMSERDLRVWLELR